MQSRSTPQGIGSLQCTLLDRRSSAPLQGARITCVGRDRRATRFDADARGRYTMSLPQGVYDLVISARGDLSLLVRGIGVLAGHTQTMTRAFVPGRGDEMRAPPATAVGGYITDRLGRAVFNVTIHITTDEGGATFTARTERDGAFLFHRVPPGVYAVTVHAADRRLLRQSLTIADADAFVRLDLRLPQL